MQGCFMENEGQWSDDIRSIASMGFDRVVFMNDSMLYDLLTDDNAKNEIVAVTNQNGHFFFEMVPGTYTIVVSKGGYRNQAQRVIVDTPVYLNID